MAKEWDIAYIFKKEDKEEALIHIINTYSPKWRGSGIKLILEEEIKRVKSGEYHSIWMIKKRGEYLALRQGYRNHNDALIDAQNDAITFIFHKEKNEHVISAFLE